MSPPAPGQRVASADVGPVGTVRIAVEDPERADVRRLLERHVTFARANSRPEDVHALEPEGVGDPAVTLYGARTEDGVLVGIGALRQLDPEHGELKSMYTVDRARRRGVGRVLLAHLLDVARERCYRRVSLETGARAAFAPARSLYRRAGFRSCPPFGGYPESPHSVCMALVLDRATDGGDPAGEAGAEPKGEPGGEPATRPPLRGAGA